MNDVKRFEYVQGKNKFVVEVGEMAKQANGAAFVHFNDTAVLTASTMSKKSKSDLDFFPLTVIYQEKLYAAGKIPGGFFKREGRPSEHETLTARLIDRPIRPLFADGFRNEVQVVNTVLSANPDYSSEMAAMLGSSISLMISDIPFEGPIAGVIVGRINGELIINPSVGELENSDMELIVAGTKEAINMVESSAKEVSEKDMLEAILFAHEEIKRLIDFQLKIINECGKEKTELELFSAPEDIKNLVTKMAKDDLVKAIVIEEKLERGNAIQAINEKVIEELTEKWADAEDLETKLKYVNESLDNIVRDEVRRLITEDKIRPDGRKVDEIRPLSSRIDVLERTHGSALFTRGQTQSLSIVTLGSLGEFQIIDGLGVEEGKRFMHHYNFPQYSVGETGRYGGPGRREVGHGALGEKALIHCIPSEEDFPYTIRLVSEVLESNGSSSQASICSSTMALMSAGVPIKSPVAGIAMGLVTKDDNYTILTDIQGMEDHLGDMDFKVAGTKDGITALQMDIKISGITKKVLEEALIQAKKGRLAILDHMLSVIPEPRKELSEYAPKVKMITIKPEKIRDVIGAGGKIITEIIEEFNDVKIDIEQDGRVFIMHHDYKWVDLAAERIEQIVREAEVNKIYTGKVVKVVDFGAFVELWPGTEGMVHISELANERVKSVKDVVNVDDEIIVKVIGIDSRNGKIKLSRKQALNK